MTTSPNSRHERLLAGGVPFAKQLLRVDLTFKFLAQVLVDYHFKVCHLIQSRIGQAINSYNSIPRVPSLWDIMAS
jgi:hypothetical protein